MKMRFAIFAWAVLLLIAVAGAATITIGGHQAYAPWEKHDASWNEELYEPLAMFELRGVYGDLKAFRFKNIGTSDVSFIVYNDAGSALLTIKLASKAEYYNRSVNTSTDDILYNYSVHATNEWISGSSLPFANLNSWWRLDTGAINSSEGTTTDNLSANTLSLGINSTSRPTFTAGKINNGTVLDGSADALSIAYSETMNLTAANASSFAMWLKLVTAPNASQTYYLWHQGDVNSNRSAWSNSTSVRFTNSTSCVFITNLGNLTRSLTYNTDTSLFDATWHHYVFQTDWLNSSIYIDGVLVAFDISIGDVINESAATFYMGDGYNLDNQSAAFYGDFAIDELYVFNTSLTAAQIGYLMGQTNKTHATMSIINKRW